MTLQIPEITPWDLLRTTVGWCAEQVTIERLNRLANTPSGIIALTTLLGGLTVVGMQNALPPSELRLGMQIATTAITSGGLIWTLRNRSHFSEK